MIGSGLANKVGQTHFIGHSDHGFNTFDQLIR